MLIMQMRIFLNANGNQNSENRVTFSRDKKIHFSYTTKIFLVNFFNNQKKNE